MVLDFIPTSVIDSQEIFPGTGPKLEKIVGRRSLVTGQPLGAAGAEAH